MSCTYYKGSSSLLLIDLKDGLTKKGGRRAELNTVCSMPGVSGAPKPSTKYLGVVLLDLNGSSTASNRPSLAELSESLSER